MMFDDLIKKLTMVLVCAAASGCETTPPAGEAPPAGPVSRGGKTTASLQEENATAPKEEKGALAIPEPVEIPRPLTREAAIGRALKGNPNLLSATARIRAANSRIHQAQAGYLPRLDFLADATRTQKIPDAFRFPWPGRDHRYETYSANLSVNWVLFDGLAREARILAGQSGWRESLSAYRDAIRLLIEAVNTAYFNALLAREEIRVAGEDAHFNTRLLKETRLKHEAGSTALSEVLNFEVRLNGAKAGLIVARSDLEVSLAALAELMGFSESFPLESIDLPPLAQEEKKDLSPPDEKEELRHALRHRPDLEQLRHAFERAKAQVDESSATSYPTVSLQAAYGPQRIDSVSFRPDDISATAGLNLAWNLFNGFSDQARKKEALALSDQARYELAAHWLAVAAQVRQAVSNLTSAQEQLELQRSNHQLSVRMRDLVLKEFQAGQASLVRLNEAQRDLVEAEVNLSQSRISLRKAWNGLDSSTSRNLFPFINKEGNTPSQKE